MSRTLWVDALDNNNVLAAPALGETDRQYDGPLRVISLEEAAAYVGSLIAPHEFKGQFLDEDPELEVDKDDYYNAHPSSINRGVYVPARQTFVPFTEENRKLVVIRDHAPDIQPAGAVAQNNGVIFHPGDHKRIAHHSGFMAKAVKWKTEEANEPVANSDNRDKIEQTILRSGGHTMESRIESIWNFDAELLDEYELFFQVFLSTRLTPPVRYRPDTVSKLMQTAENKIHRIAETSKYRRGLKNYEVQAMHRAITSNLYRRGSTGQLRMHWQAYAIMGGRYANARIAKIHQARRGCEQELTKYQPALAAKTAS